MKTAVFEGQGQIRPCEKSIPQPSEKEILVQVLAAGICGTDVHIYFGHAGATEASVPVVLGHEFAGRVVKTGPDVSRIKEGDLVTVDPNMYCGNCDACHKGQKQYCDSMSAIGVNQDGGFEEYCVVPESQAIVLPDTTDPEEAAFCEPVACALHGLDNIQMKAGDSVLIIGGGAIGQIMAQLARLSGAGTVIVSEPVAMRRQLALDLGADGVINPTSGSIKEQLRELTSKDSTDVIIECVGRPIAVQQAFEAAGKGSRILIFSVPSPGDTVQLPLSDVFAKELTIKGSFVNPNTQLPAARLIGSGRLNLKPLITHRYPVEKLEEAIRMQMGPDSVKVMIIPGLDERNVA